MLETRLREPTNVETQEGINQSTFSSQPQTYSTQIYHWKMMCNVKEYYWALPDICHARLLDCASCLKLHFSATWHWYPQLLLALRCMPVNSYSAQWWEIFCLTHGQQTHNLNIKPYNKNLIKESKPVVSSKKSPNYVIVLLERTKNYTTLKMSW